MRGASSLASAVMLASMGAAIGGEDVQAPLIVTTVEHYEDALARLAPSYEATLVGITADWCAYCRTIEDAILPHPDVQELLNGIGLIKIDVTAAAGDTADLLFHVDAWGPPTFFVVDTATGREHAGTRSLGPFTAEDLIARLTPFAP